MNRRYTFIKLIVLGLYAAIFLVSIFILPQAAQARDNDDAEVGRLVGANSSFSDGSGSALDGQPGTLSTGRYSNHVYKSNASAGLIHDGGFSLNLVKPETHGKDDVGATAGWSWDF